MTFTETDMHVHTNLSLCASPSADPFSYIEYGEKNGLKTIGFANHYWDEDVDGASPWYKQQDTAHIMQLREQLGDTGRFPIKVLIGCETEYANHTLGISAKKAEMLDYVLVPHSHTHMKGFVLPQGCEAPEKHANYLVQSFYEVATHKLAAKYITGIVHPFFPCGKEFDEITEILKYITDEQFYECACAAKENNIAIEINTSCICSSNLNEQAFAEYKRFYDQCKKADCRFFAGSDKHTTIKNKSDDLFYSADKIAAKLDIF